jgi:lipopolysaccharide/colanic/teichoic acid biosynthesis glycosyltransferase
MASDFAAALVACGAALLFWFRDEIRPAYVLLTLLAPLVWVAAVAAQRGYERRFLGTGPGEYRRLADATLLVFAGAAGLSFSLKGELSRGYLMISLPLALALSFVGRRQLRSWLFRRRLAGQGMQRVLVVGRSDAVSHLVEQLDREPWHGLAAVAACVIPDPDYVPPQSREELTVTDAAVGETAIGEPAAVGESAAVGEPAVAQDGSPEPSTRLIGAGAESIVAAIKELDIEVVAVASNPDLSGNALRRLAWLLEERGVELIVSPGIIEVAGPRLSIRPVAGLSLLHMERPATKGGRVLIKSVLDRMIALGLLITASPLLVATALAVKISSPGPVLFRQTRIGVGGKQFQMLKFRSMVVDAEERRIELAGLNEDDGVKFKIRQDPRVTRLGSWLRRFSVDELPQLWNVVRGEMALVGPRPPLPEEVARYDSDATRRLRVRPGLTGLWQVSGRSDLSWEESLRLDLRYVDNWSFVMDMSILWRTWRAVISRNGAY